jgi:hypothetical protein
VGNGLRTCKNALLFFVMPMDRLQCRDQHVSSPHAKVEEDTRTPEELLDLIEAKGREVMEALAVLRNS